MAEKARYVDADRLKEALDGMFVASGTNYSSGAVDGQINNMISMALNNALQSFKAQLSSAINLAAVPYDKCMLCVQKDSCIPPHPLGDNR